MRIACVLFQSAEQKKSRLSPRMQPRAGLANRVNRGLGPIVRIAFPHQQPVGRPAPFTRTDRGMNAVIEASADFLRRKSARADSADIQEELVRCGILEDGPRDRSRITSYLGRAKAMFDNVRGEGYGLTEWRTPSG